MFNKQCCSPSSIKADLEVVRRKVSLPETDSSWTQIEQGIIKLTECCKNGGCEFVEEMVAGMRSLARPLNRILNSKRSKLSGSALNLITYLLSGLGPAFDPLVSLFLPSLLELCAQTNMALTRRAKACISAIIRGTHSSSILPHLAKALQHKSASVRIVAAEGVLACLTCSSPIHIETDTHRAHLLENVMKLTSQDVSAEVRQVGKKISEACKAWLPDRVERLPVVTKKKSAMKGTAALQLTSRVLSRDHQTTARARPTVPIAQKVTSAKPSDRRGHPLGSRLPHDIRTVRPVPTSKPTSARQCTVRSPSAPCPLQWLEKSTDEKPCIGALSPTAPLPEICGTEGTQATRIRKGGPPPFKPVSRMASRTLCVISTCEPKSSTPVPVKPVYRKGLLYAYAEYLNTAHMGSEINHPRLSITDLRRSPQALRQKKPKWRGQPSPKPVIKTLLGGMRIPDTSKPFLPPSSAVTVPPPSSPPCSTHHWQSAQFEAAVSGGDSISTTPKGSPPVRATAHALRVANHVDPTRPRCMEGSTSTTPVTWPTHCADLFASSLHGAYVSPKCVSDRLKRAPRNYRPPRDCLDTPSPCDRVKATYSHSPATTPPSRIICRSNLYTSTGKNLKPFQLQLSLEFKSKSVELSLSTNPQPCIAAQVPVVPPMPAWLKELFEKCPPPSFEMCIRNRFEFESR